MSNLTSIAGRIAHCVLTAALLAASCGASITYAEEAPAPVAGPPADGHVIPPGQEELLAGMLGRGATLPGDCQFASGQINGPVVLGTYTCSGGQVVFELRHPNGAVRAATQTEKFAVALQSGSPPAGLADTLVERIRSREGDFEWLSLAPPTTVTSWRLAYIAIALLLVIAALGWSVRRRRAADQRAA